MEWTPDEDLYQLVARAQRGDRTALEQIIHAIQNQMHHLAMRILLDPEVARDATQEILILVVTKLSTFAPWRCSCASTCPIALRTCSATSLNWNRPRRHRF